MYWPGLDPGIFGVVGDFPHVSASCCCRFGAILCTPSPWASYIFAQVVLTFVCWLTRWGVILGQRKANSLYACVPSPGLELASAPLTLVKHHTHRKVACLCPQRPDKGGAVRQACYLCVSTSLSIMRTLIRSSDEDLWNTVHVHPDCPSPPIAGLQNYATSSSYYATSSSYYATSSSYYATSSKKINYFANV